MSDIITNTTNTNDCKVFKVYLSKYTATTISSNSVINNSTVNGINVTDALNNLQNSKLDKGTYTGNADDILGEISEEASLLRASILLLYSASISFFLLM